MYVDVMVIKPDMRGQLNMLPYGWAAAIVLYEKQQVAIHQEDGPVGSPSSFRVGDTYALADP
jgi:hypothetical protein